ncbi:hypothetical protein [Streptomyces klenkii]|uniref:hypothetical protein n=1 Tax=Streptomyces klenkii TaxID=1420899 RepID=UPI0034398782
MITRKQLATALRRFRPVCPRPGRTGFRRWVPSWRRTLGLFGCAVTVVAGVLTIMFMRTAIPAGLNAFATQQDNVHYWDDGSEMTRTGEVDRQDTPLDQVPEKVRWATPAAENETFRNRADLHELDGMRRVSAASSSRTPGTASRCPW